MKLLLITASANISFSFGKDSRYRSGIPVTFDATSDRRGAAMSFPECEVSNPFRSKDTCRVGSCVCGH